MCGICGIVDRDGRPIDRAVLERMRDAMTHRGPDAEGLYEAAGVGLGHRRLSIIDLATGSQPMTNEDGSLVIVYNGEVYNYLELRETYLDGRHRFTSTSDTEVILHLFEEFGRDAVAYLNGMFAFAIWDRTSRRLLLARDRLGVKPLYYTVLGGRTLLFASEIKALLQHPGVAVSVSPEALDEYMTFGYVQTPRTLLAGIERLPEGHTLEWHRGQLTVRRYWDLDFSPDTSLSEDEHVRAVGSLLGDAVRLRQRSDVPMGVLLSGGLDSSTVAALVAGSVGHVKTFSVGFDVGSGCNELPWARRVAAWLATDHHEIIVEPSRFRDFIPRFVYQMDEPVTESAGIPLYFVSELAGRSVKVVLSGEGADELFAGYPIYERMRLVERYRRLPDWLRRFVHPMAAGLGALHPKLGKYVDLTTRPLSRRYLNVHLYDVRLRDRIYSPGFRQLLGAHDPVDALAPLYASTAPLDPVSRMLQIDTKTWLPNDILIKADRMSMAASIELRVPFLDYRLAEYAARIPAATKLRGGRTKHVVKRVAERLLPREIIDRPKMGFPTPLAHMFRTELAEYVADTLLDGHARGRGYFDPSVVERSVRAHRTGAADEHQLLWRLVVLEEWHRQFVDGARPPVAEPRPRAVHGELRSRVAPC
jgi:asparagine synthase (glutamine-hydrolysing)